MSQMKSGDAARSKACSLNPGEGAQAGHAAGFWRCRGRRGARGLQAGDWGRGCARVDLGQLAGAGDGRMQIDLLPGSLGALLLPLGQRRLLRVPPARVAPPGRDHLPQIACSNRIFQGSAGGPASAALVSAVNARPHAQAALCAGQKVPAERQHILCGRAVQEASRPAVE